MTLKSYQYNLEDTQQRELYVDLSGIACPRMLCDVCETKHRHMVDYDHPLDKRTPCSGEMLLSVPLRRARDTKLRRARCEHCGYFGWV